MLIFFFGSLLVLIIGHGFDSKAFGGERVPMIKGQGSHGK
jgi:hypothetical protein